MIDIRKDTGPHAKCYFSHSLLPSYIDPQNVSAKKKPFSTFNNMKFAHTVDLTLPEEIYELVKVSLEDEHEKGIGRLQYARVHMKLSEVLDGEFFTEYIKKGNIMMLSEGRPLVDNVFSFYEGTLRLELDRPTYERCGLQGTPIEDGGKKHQKSRWVVEVNLRQPSMLHGKRAFGRLEWACKNVLNNSLTWLFYNFNPTSRESLAEGKEPIHIHAPAVKEVVLEKCVMRDAVVPELRVLDLEGLYGQHDALDLLEYLNLLGLCSERLDMNDRIDPFLSRYEVPILNRPFQIAKNMVRLRWRGFIPPQFVRELFLAVRKYGLKISKEEQDGEGGTISGEEKRWFALSATAFGGERAYTIMQWAGRETLSWEIES